MQPLRRTAAYVFSYHTLSNFMLNIDKKTPFEMKYTVDNL